MQDKRCSMKGYDGTSVANIIESVGISKGTFYHYFASKADLLDQIIERQSERVDETIDPIIEDDGKGAVEKFNALFLTVGQYKAANKSVMMMLARMLYTEGNLILHNKMTRNRIKIVTPKLAQIVAQGISKGVFKVDSTVYAAEMILEMGNSLGDEFGRIVMERVLSSTPKHQYLERCEAYDRAVERMIGAQEGSLCLFDREVPEVFFDEEL